MTKLEHIQATIAWAEKWLATPESELPGKLSHEKCGEALEAAHDELLDYTLEHARFSATPDGMRFSHLATE